MRSTTARAASTANGSSVAPEVAVASAGSLQQMVVVMPPAYTTLQETEMRTRLAEDRIAGLQRQLPFGQLNGQHQRLERPKQASGAMRQAFQGGKVIHQLFTQSPFFLHMPVEEFNRRWTPAI
jgi:hypothetical protein